jgi:hypothetical protein
MRKLRVLLFFFLVAGVAHAQGVIHNNIAFGNVNGFAKPISGAQITVCTGIVTFIPCSPQAQVYSNQDLNASHLLTQPFSADSGGNYFFWAAPNSLFTVCVAGSGFTTYCYTWQTTSLVLGTLQRQIFTSNGTFTIPAAVTTVEVTVVGGGGGGGGATNAAPGLGGTAGGASIKLFSGLTPGGTLVVTVGTGGSGGAAGANNGGNGTSSSLVSGTQIISTITAQGGHGGTGGTSGGVNDVAAFGSGGDLNLQGGGATQIASGSLQGSTGGASLFGGGAQGGFGASGVSTATFGAGGGGGGANAGNQVGGTGGPGIVIFKWIQ